MNSVDLIQIGLPILSFLCAAVSGLFAFAAKQWQRQQEEVFRIELSRLEQAHRVHLKELDASMQEKLLESRAAADITLKHIDHQLSTAAAKYQEVIAPRQRVVIDHLAKTRHLLARVNVSFSRLAKLAPKLGVDELLAETTNTLDLYAEFRQHLSSEDVVSYPKDLIAEINKIQQSLSYIFLDLQLNRGGGTLVNLQSELERHLSDLSFQAATAEALIADQLRVPLN